MGYIKITRYSEENIIDYEGNSIYEIRDKIDTSFRDGDIDYVVKDSFKLTDIAMSLYNDARLWWIIAEFNDIIDPFKKIDAGTILRCPSLRRINEEII
jgi:nucleoid-associated protein YgaU